MVISSLERKCRSMPICLPLRLSFDLYLFHVPIFAGYRSRRRRPEQEGEAHGAKVGRCLPQAPRQGLDQLESILFGLHVKSLFVQDWFFYLLELIVFAISISSTGFWCEGRVASSMR